MRVEVTQEALVFVSAGCHKVYQPGVHVAPRAHIEQIEAQGKGKRIEKDAARAETESGDDA